MSATLVAPPDAFVGREREIEATREALGTARLVTLLGPAGIGKTRLALELLGRLGAESVRCDLSRATTEHELWAALAQALALLEASGVVDAERLGRALARRGPIVVLLDNFEQLSAEGARLPGLLAAAPGARLLVTSRERLRVRGEVCIEVPPLGVPNDGEASVEAIAEADSVRLLLARARAVGASALDSPDELRAVGAICRRVEGIPLALELCASRMRALGAGPLLERLSSLLGALSGSRGARGAPERQATLRAAVAWSWELLAPDEQRALGRASVFRGGFDLEAAAAVLAPEAGEQASERAAELLAALVDKSLVRRVEGAGARYALLESVRELADERLWASGEAGQTRRAHAAYYLGQAARWASWSGEGEDPRRREASNLLAVCERALSSPAEAQASGSDAAQALVALEPHFLAHGPLPQYASLLARALSALPPGGDPLLRARATLSHALAVLFMGKADEGLSACERALDASREAGAPALGAMAASKAASLLSIAGRQGESGRLFAVAAALAEHSAEAQAILASDVSVVASRAGEAERALGLRRRALSLFLRLGDRTRAGLLYGYVGESLLELGHHHEARKACHEGLSLLRAEASARFEGRVLATLGRGLQADGLLDEAASAFEQAIAIESRVGERWYEGVRVMRLGDVRIEQGEIEAALQLYRRASRLLADAGDPLWLALCVGREASALCLLGRPAEASPCFDDAARLLAPLGIAWALASLDLQRGLLSLALARRSSGPASLDLRAAAERALASLDRALPAGVRPLSACSEDVRLFARVLQADLARFSTPALPSALPSAAQASPASSLRVGPDARWFERAGAERVSLERRRPARRLLLRLATERLAHPGSPLTVAALFRAAWPADRIDPRAAANRVHVALSELRRLGLRDVLLRREDGFLLDPDVDLLPVRWPRGG